MVLNVSASSGLLLVGHDQKLVAQISNNDGKQSKFLGANNWVLIVNPQNSTRHSEFYSIDGLDADAPQ